MVEIALCWGICSCLPLSDPEDGASPASCYCLASLSSVCGEGKLAKILAKRWLGQIPLYPLSQGWTDTVVTCLAFIPS